MKNVPCQACGFDPTQKINEVGTLYLSCELLSGNKTGSNGKGASGWKYRKAADKYSRAVNLSEPLPLAAPGSRRRVTITRLYRTGRRKFDKDNLVWGCKPLVDVLKKRGYIFDDNPKHVEVVYLQKPGGTNFDRIEILVEEFE